MIAVLATSFRPPALIPFGGGGETCADDRFGMPSVTSLAAICLGDSSLKLSQIPWRTACLAGGSRPSFQGPERALPEAKTAGNSRKLGKNSPGTRKFAEFPVFFAVLGLLFSGDRL
jgi:hypothetical protein